MEHHVTCSLTNGAASTEPKQTDKAASLTGWLSSRSPATNANWARPTRTARVVFYSKQPTTVIERLYSGIDACAAHLKRGGAKQVRRAVRLEHDLCYRVWVCAKMMWCWMMLRRLCREHKMKVSKRIHPHGWCIGTAHTVWLFLWVFF